MKRPEHLHLLLGKMLNCKLAALLLCISKADVSHLLKYFRSLAEKKKKNGTKLSASNSIVEESFSDPKPEKNLHKHNCLY